MFDERIHRDPATGLTLDLSDAPEIPSASGLPARLEQALAAMARLEAGEIANVDEGRAVGHYWLRAPDLAPTAEIRAQILASHARLRALEPGSATDLLVIGVGGSILGPQLLHDVLRQPGDRLGLHFLDNTDPDGYARALAAVDPRRCLALVCSKSGTTPETQNGLFAAKRHFAAAGVRFEAAAFAVAGPDSPLYAEAAAWRDRFPFWPWVGGRNSVTSPVGLVPMALAGYDWEGLLAGAAAMDGATRAGWRQNPAALLAATWYVAGSGEGHRNLVIQPYRDRLAMLSRALQQLVMESLGKRLNRAGVEVNQGINVLGNKGSTDQHALIQQIRDGRDDALVHFIHTLSPGAESPGVNGWDASDHLVGLLLGTRDALAARGRPSLILSTPDASARSLGALVALFERAVGLYAELIDVNGYNQPGVEAGKEAAREALALLGRLAAALPPEPTEAGALAAQLGAEARLVWRLLHQLAATGRATVLPGPRPSADRFHRAAP